MSTPSYETKTIKHLGMVAGRVAELGIVELIDELIEQDHRQRQVSIGQAVKAIIVNGLGFAILEIQLDAARAQARVGAVEAYVTYKVATNAAEAAARGVEASEAAFQVTAAQYRTLFSPIKSQHRARHC